MDEISNLQSVLRNSVESVMKGEKGDPAFSSLLEFVLYVCSKTYTAGVMAWSSLYEKDIVKPKRLPCKVISIGNITAGGTGKTPVVHYVSKLLKDLGLDVAIISRGYGGAAQRAGGVVSDGNKIVMGPKKSGDEPQLLASRLRGIPVLIGRNRYRSGRRAVERFGSSALIMDDGFQHLALRRDLNLLLLDSARPFGNGHCIPRGTLREPIDQLKRANGFILTRCKHRRGMAEALSALESNAPGRPVFTCRHVPERLFVAGSETSMDLASLGGQRVLAFSGIAQNKDFHSTITGLGGELIGSSEFPDHHVYSYDDLKSIWKMAADLEADSIVTTEKDYHNIRSEVPSAPRLLVLGIAVSFGDDSERFRDYLKKELEVDRLLSK